MSPKACWLLENEIIPRLRIMVPSSVPQIGHEDHEELIQDTTLMAARMLKRLEERGKQVTPGNIAHYTVLHARSGRRSYGQSLTDVMHPKARMETSGDPDSLDDVVREGEFGGEPLTLNDVFPSDAEDPARACARKMDWEEFMARQDRGTVALIICMSEGRALNTVALELKLSVSTMQTRKRELALKVKAFMGPDVLAIVQEGPRWKDGILGQREKQACREERR